MIQQLADHIDQLDLTLDQLALRDRNFDRFALLLIDNVVELVLHQFAQDKSVEFDRWQHSPKQLHDREAAKAALGHKFDKKVSFARDGGLARAELAQSILYLHGFRNTAYHRGLRHEGILHDLAIFYFRNACDLLSAYSPSGWSSSNRDTLSHRAVKYLGTTNLPPWDRFGAAWKRLDEVASKMDCNLISNLHLDMSRTIEHVDGHLDLLVDSLPKGSSRNDVVVDCQAWSVAFSEQGQSWASANACPKNLSVQGFVDWIAQNYNWNQKVDPIPSWESRLRSLETEKNLHSGLKKYCDFMKQTEVLRGMIEESTASFEAHIQHQIDVARGK